MANISFIIRSYNSYDISPFLIHLDSPYCTNSLYIFYLYRNKISSCLPELIIKSSMRSSTNFSSSQGKRMLLGLSSSCSLLLALLSVVPKINDGVYARPPVYVPRRFKDKNATRSVFKVIDGDVYELESQDSMIDTIESAMFPQTVSPPAMNRQKVKNQ